MNGILNLDKPAGLTSFDVVAKVKAILHEKKVGHGGTLDPLATGVLPIFIGQATRLVEYASEFSKTYRAVVELGMVTDTYDAEGKVTQKNDPTGITEAMVRAALDSFLGDIMQSPPIYSALKQKGTPLYRLARQGKEPVVEERLVRIHRISLLEFCSPLVSFEAEVSKGTYIRSLAFDLGEALGCGAYLKSLRRTAYGAFNIADALTLKQVGGAVSDGTLAELLQPMDAVLSSWPAVKLTEEQALNIIQGKSQALPNDGERLRAYYTDGRFFAILNRDSVSGLWQPHKVFITRL